MDVVAKDKGAGMQPTATFIYDVVAAKWVLSSYPLSLSLSLSLSFSLSLSLSLPLSLSLSLSLSLVSKSKWFSFPSL